MSSAAGSGLMTRAMALKARFWKWALLFGASGLLVPAEFIIRWTLFGGSVSEFEFVLWPSSFMFQALADAPSPEPTSTVVFIYAIAMIENIILYAGVGALLSLLVNAVLRLSALGRGQPKST
jgi:hypothetical protein